MLLLSLLQAFSLTLAPGPQRVDFGTCPMREGEPIEDCHLGYQWFGDPEPDGSNVVIVPTWFSGDAEGAGRLIAHGGLVDESKYALLVIDAFGAGASSSPSKSVTQRGLRFPRVSIPDMVQWQHRLAHEVLGLQRVRAVMGISMGGMQALQWAVSFPDFMESVINIVGTPKPTAADVALWGPQIAALEGLVRLGHVRHADTALQLRAMLTQDLAGRLPLSALGRRVTARTLMILDANDLLLRPGPSLELAKVLHSEVRMFRSACGHLSPALCERERAKAEVNAFLAGESGRSLPWEAAL